MGFTSPVIFCALLCISYSLILNVHSAPLQIFNGNNRSVDEPVEELESLKENERKEVAAGEIRSGLVENKSQSSESNEGKPLQLSISAATSSVFSDINGRRQGHTQTQKQMNKNGELVAKMSQKTELAQEPEGKPHAQTKLELEVPSEGIHRAVEREEEPDSALEKMNAISGLEYTPLDMAEYVFWTGDEKGVTLAIEDFLQEGLMSREEAINFLQSIKTNLDYIQAHYQGLRKMEEKIANKLQQQMSADENNDYEKKLRNTFLDAINAKSKQDKNSEEIIEEKRKRTEGEEYDELLDKLKSADQMYNDYSLEEIIYQLAKLMFSQSLSQGSVQAHQALSRFTDYLEKEVAYGQISRQLEKKILGVLVAALSDTLGERPELLPAASEGLSNIGAQDLKSERGSTLSAQESRSHILERRSQSFENAAKKTKRFIKFSELRNHAAVRRSLAPASYSSMSFPRSRVSIAT